MKSSKGRLRVATAVAAGVVIVALGQSANAAEAESRQCRSEIAKAGNSLSKTTLKFIDSCHKGQNKLLASTAVCNAVAPGVAPFDPKIKYQASRDKLALKVAGRCLAGDPVLANYPTMDVDADLFPIIEGQAAGNTIIAAGGPDLDGNKVNIKCHETILKERGKIFAEILKESTKCQAALDKLAVTFGPLDPTCVRTAVKAGPKATASLTKACIDAGVVPGDIGACTPFPACVVDNAQLAAQTSTSALYDLASGGVCGNNVVEAPEQCDDGNGNDGDGCSASCETEGKTCTDFSPNTIIGPRTVTVAVNVPGAAKLAGVQVVLEYPQFQAGIPGEGLSSIVAANVGVLQDTTVPGDYLSAANDTNSTLNFVIAAAEEFIDDGNLFAVTMDACVAKELNLCNRNQNVIGCCNAATDEDGDLLFQECADFNIPVSCGSSFSTTLVQEGGPEDCCPADNACVTQASATECIVSSASDINGQPVDGVTCSVVLSGN
jgi:cysteine-rich repeat protein